MNYCHVCSHNRLLHDSWGCKTKCGCGVSIIYLTPASFSGKTDSAADQRLINEGYSLDRDTDRSAESFFKMMLQRSFAETNTVTLEGEELYPLE